MTDPLITVSELFTPMPSGVGRFGNIAANPDINTWLGRMLFVATQVKLPTTSWQSGAPELSIFAVEAVMFSLSDANISTMAQGGFLQSAAFGTTTFVTIDGIQVTIPVTPDPSNPAQNPSGAPGWLDALTEATYDVTRLQATFATGPLAIAKLSAGTIGPFAAGLYHVASISGPTYVNAAALTIPSGIIAGTGGVITAVGTGFSSTIITTQTAHGLTPGQSVYVLVPISAGISGLTGVFALVTASTSTTFQIGIGSSGTYTSGGNVFLCTVATMKADVVGMGSNAGPGQVTTTVTQNASVFVSNIVAWSGSNWESNAHLVTRTQLSLASRSPNGPSQAYIYFAETAQQLLAAATPAYILTNGPVQANSFSRPADGLITTVVASETPASTTLGQAVTPGVSQLAVSGVSNANPCVVTCAGPTTLTPGQSMTVTITGVLGTGGVNGTFIGTYDGSANAFSIPVDTTSTGAYTGGGSVEGGDLGQIDALLQQNVVPDRDAAVTVSALALPIQITATVVVPAANVTAYQLAVVIQLQAQIASYAIGGNSPAFEVLYDDIVGALEEAGVIAVGQASYVRQIQSLSINGLGVNVGVPFPSQEYQAIFATPSITVVGV